MYAPGLPDKRHKEVPRISSPQIWNLAIQKHDAKRAGTHYDLRLVDDKAGKAYSWAVRNLPTLPGDKTLAVLQPVHTAEYSTWSGTIDSGYGAGNVKLFQNEKTEIIKADLDHIIFNVYKTNGDTERYALIHTGGDDWLFHNVTVTRSTRPEIPDSKPQYKSVNISKVDVNNSRQILAPKIDGALNVFRLKKDKPVEVYSYRPSKKGSNKLIDHTYRSQLYTVPVPKTFKGTTVLLGEVFARKHDGTVLPATDTSARLLSNVWRSRELQEQAPLDNVVFNILRYNGRDVSNKPYSEKLELLKKVTRAIPQLKMPPLATSPESKQQLLKDIKTGNNELSSEGVVIYDLDHHTPLKSKIQEDYDVYIRDIFPGEGRLAGTHAGGFTYSHSSQGPIAGKVGTGFDDATRKDMWENPKKWKGQVARVWAQQQYGSGALRAPAYKDLRPEMWIRKKASFTEKNFKHTQIRAKERYAIDLTKDLVHKFNTDIQTGISKFIRSHSPTSDIYEIEHSGKKMRVYYSPRAKTITSVVQNWAAPLHMTEAAQAGKLKILGKIDLNTLKKIAAVQLKPYQEDLKKKLQKQHGMVVAWGLGSGKTIGSIAAADQFGPTKAVVPASLRENFKKELKAYKPKNKFEVDSYESFVKNPTGIQGKTVIFDEAHRLRTSGSKRSQIAQSLSSSANKAILLTGTPIQNAPHEIAPLINIAAGKTVLPTDAKEFNSRYVQRTVDNPGFIRRAFGAKFKDEYHAKNLDDFRARVKPYISYHGNRGDDSMPSVHQKHVDIEMSPTQTKVYKTLEKQLPGRIQRSIQRSLPADKKNMSRLNAFLSATRQVANSGDKFYQKGGVKEYSPKLKAIANTVAGNKGQALIYSNYLQAGANPLSELLTQKKVPHAVFTGNINDVERKNMVKSYNNKKIRALIVSSSGGEGLDLKNTRQVHITEPHWNDAKIDQVVGRSARLGSHAKLPKEDRTVDVFKYRSVLPEKRHGFLWLKKDRPISSDQYLENMSKRKSALNNEFIGAIKQAEMFMSTAPRMQNVYDEVSSNTIEETDMKPQSSRNPNAYKQYLIEQIQKSKVLTKPKNNSII